MADSVERLLIRIDASTESLRRELKAADKAVTDSASIVEKAQQRMNSAWQGANKYVNQHQTELKLLGAAAVGATALAMRSIINYSDSYQRLQGQLKLVTSSQDELNRVYNATLSLANETGTSLDSTVNLYARLTRATEELGLTETERLRITESINKAMVVSGASTAEAEAAIKQLSQGMASGVLRGEELNSVMENSPRLAKALADGLGVGIGQLREMGKAGELTGEKVAGALLKMGGEIDEEFTRMPMTVERAMNRISNAMADAIGRADMSPLIASIGEFEKAVSDPSVVQGLTDIASAIVSVTVKAGQFIAAMGGMAKATGEWVASIVSDFDPDDIAAMGVELERLHAQLKAVEEGGSGTSPRAERLRKEIKEMEAIYNLQIELINNANDAREREATATDKQADSYDGLSEVVVSATKKQSAALTAYQKAQDKARVTASKLADAEAQRVRKVTETTSALDRQLTAIKMTDRAQVIYNATMDAAEYAHGEELAAIVDKTVALYDQQQAIEATGIETERAAQAAEDAAKVSAQAAEDAMQPWNDALQDMAANIDQGFSQAWTDAFSGAADGFKNFADNMKNAFFNLLGNLAHLAISRPIVMQLSAAMGGLVPGAASAGVPGASMGGLGSMFSGGIGGMGQGFYEGVGNVASNMGFTGIGDAAYTKGLNTTGWTIGADIAGGFIGGLAGNKVFGETTGIGAGLGGIAGSIAIPIPGIGAAVGSFLGSGIEKALDKVFGGNNDGSNAGASDFNLADRTNVGRTWGKTPGPENADAAVQLAAGLQQFADAIGGSSLAANITVGNREGIKYGNQSFGQDAEAFYKVAFRDVIENATGLNDALKELALAFEGTAEETATYIMAMSNMAEAVQTNPVEQAMADMVTSLNNSSLGMMGAYRKQVDALNLLITEYDGSAAATVELNDALVVSRNNAYQLAVAIMEMSGAIGTMLGDQAKYFREAVMTEEELRAAREKQRTDILAQLKTASDPQEVMALVTDFATVNKQLFDSLSEEQRLAQVDTFTSMTEQVDAIAQSILGAALSDLQLSQEEINARMVESVLGAAATMQTAADDMGGHVATFGDYVQQLVTRGIRIVVGEQTAEVAA